MCQITAYHEAGHAFMAVYVGGRVRSVTITPDNDDGPARFGDTQIEWRGPSGDGHLTKHAILVALAGPVAEMIHRGEPYHPGFVAEWAADWETAWNLAASLAKDARTRMALLERLTAQLYALLNAATHWAAIAAIVDHLEAHEILEGEEVAEIVNTWLGLR